MAFKLTAAALKEYRGFLAAADDKASEFNEALAEFNSKLAELFEPVTEALEAFNETQDELKEFVETTASDWQDQFDERSEKWQEGERGQVVNSLIEAWTSAAGDMDALELDKPEEIELDIPDFSEELPSDVAEM